MMRRAGLFMGSSGNGGGPGCYKKMAEREGFEPPLPFRVNLISSQAPSTGLGHLSASMRIAVSYPRSAFQNLRQQTTGRRKLSAFFFSNRRKIRSTKRCIPLPERRGGPAGGGSDAHLRKDDRAIRPPRPWDRDSRRRAAPRGLEERRRRT